MSVTSHTFISKNELQTQVFDTNTNTNHCSAWSACLSARLSARDPDLAAEALRSWSPSQGRWLGLDSPLFPSRHARCLGFVAWLKWWSWWWSIGQVWKWWFSQWFENGKGDRKMRILTRVQWTKHIQCRYSGNPGFNKKKLCYDKIYNSKQCYVQINLHKDF